MSVDTKAALARAEEAERYFKAQRTKTTFSHCDHGHVFPNKDGSRARCGGPGLCKLCSVDLAQKALLDTFTVAAAAEWPASASDVRALVREVEELRKRPLRTFDQRAADRLADEVAVLITRRVIDSRSPAADALLDYREGMLSERSDRLAALEAELERLRAHLNRDLTNEGWWRDDDQIIRLDIEKRWGDESDQGVAVRIEAADEPAQVAA